MEWSPSVSLHGQATDTDVEINLTEGTAFAAVASPDRQSIAIDLLGALWVLPIGGGEAKKITPDVVEARRPSWSPDSRSLAFQGYGDAWHIYTIGIDGSGFKAITSGPFDDREPDWSRDGRRIAFASDRVGGISSIWEVEIDSGAVRQVSNYLGHDPCWSPSDRDVVFFGGPTERAAGQIGVWVAAPNEAARWMGSRQDVSPTPRTALTNPCATGRTFDVVSTYVRDEDRFPLPSQWLTPTELLYTADGHIKRTGRGGPSIIPFRAPFRIRRPAFQRTHRVLQPIPPQPVRGIVNPAVSPDGTQVAFAALGDLWVMSFGQPPKRLTDDPFVELDPAWSPDGTRLAFACDRAGSMALWVHDFRSDADMQITMDGEKGTVSEPAWSPNGQRIAYLVNRRALHVVDVESGISRVWMQHPTDLGRPSWAPDDKRVGSSVLLSYEPPGEGTNQLTTVTSDSGRAVAQVLHLHHSVGNRINNGPVWAPDGTRMAYVTEGRLWTVGIGLTGAPSGDPNPMTDDLPDSPSWQADAQHLVYLTANGLRRVSADGGVLDRHDIPLDLRWQELLPGRLVIHAGALFDGRTPELRRDIDVVVDRGRIQSVEPHQDASHVGQVIDSSNDTVMPGLIDMHARLDNGYGEALGRLLLAYGVTSVRDSETTAFAGLEQRESYDAGRRIGPRVFLSGDPLTGARVYDAGEAPVTSDQQLQKVLERGSGLGLDFFSTYARLPDTDVRRVTEYAHAQGVSVTSRQIYPAVAVGVDGVEGLDPRGRRRMSVMVSSRLVSYRDVIDVIAKSGMTLTPMIGAMSLGPIRGFVAKVARDPTLLVDPRLRLLPASRAAEFQAQGNFLRDRRSEETRAATAVAALENTVSRIVAAGGRIVSGSGAPDVPYGLGLHLELVQLVDAGLTPFQALQTVTINAASALGVDDELGTIEPGRLADLVFVGGDPLHDIRHARDVRRVMRGGRYYDLTTLLN